MKSKQIRPYFLLLLLIVTGGFALSILHPYILTLILAGIFSVVLFPLYSYFLKKLWQKKSLAVTATILLIILCLIIPLSYVGTHTFAEAMQAYPSLERSSADFDLQLIAARIGTEAEKYVPGAGAYISSLPAQIDTYAKQLLSWTARNIGSVFSNIANFGFHLFIFLMALYYLLTTGSALRKKYISVSPLEDRDDEILLTKIERAINAVVKGTIGTAVIQGTVASIGFAIFGLPNPFLWGVVCAFAALLPIVGTSVVFIPAVLYLFFTGNTTSALGLALWGIVAVGLIDNFVSPLLSRGGTGLNSLITLLSVFGGFILFGATGVLLGPILMSIFFAVFAIQISATKKADAVAS